MRKGWFSGVEVGYLHACRGQKFYLYFSFDLFHSLSLFFLSTTSYNKTSSSMPRPAWVKLTFRESDSVCAKRTKPFHCVCVCVCVCETAFCWGYVCAYYVCWKGSPSFLPSTWIFFSLWHFQLTSLRSYSVFKRLWENPNQMVGKVLLT